MVTLCQDEAQNARETAEKVTRRLAEVARAADGKRGADSASGTTELSKLQQSRANLLAKVRVD